MYTYDTARADIYENKLHIGCCYIEDAEYPAVSAVLY